MKSPLFDWHVANSAKLADFGGWDMPIEYPKGVADFPGGTLAEHAAVRERVGIFDVSHLGKVSVKGAGAKEFVNTMVTNDLHRITPGSAQYNLFCNEEGGVIDDLIIYEFAADDIFIIPNAANCATVAADLKKFAPNGIEVSNIHQDFAVLAIQGPDSAKVLANLGLHLDLEYMSFTKTGIPNFENLGEVIICRTGYSGEFGFELLPKWESALKIWELLVNEIAKFDGRVCGLGARDTLRTEMGYPLHGHELSIEISPVQASANWAVVLSKSEFRGKSALEAEKSKGPKQVLRALKSNDRGIPRAEMAVQDLAGAEVGIVTSGTFSPTLKVGIALALLNPEIKLGDTVQIDIRGRISQATVVKAPFVESKVR
ncbi:MAG: glycine cleavage system aminomethyltransferase GcvT [Actinobacteria bacterium]|uniref:aminomethyltransferase n=1 Tax=freshwater metagenome TaxID=449393 RepID=A0A6J6PHX3_9ZZZZ|nr:glycine cleavage system aminomethyltransferase GcvT [Actinomycetota bacterium]